MKEAFGFIKNLLENKRTRSLAILIIYFIFFLFVFSFLSSANTPTKQEGSNTNEDNTQDVYEDEFYYLNNIEILSYNAYDLYGNIVEVYNTNLVNGEVIYNIVKNSVLASTNHIEKSNTYYLSIKDYERIINDMTVEIDGNIIIIVSDSSIVLDFTNYYGYKINIDIRS